MPEVTKVKVRIGSSDYQMVVNWHALSRVTDEVGDPLQLMRRYEQGDDSWVTVTNVAKILSIGTATSDLEDLAPGQVGDTLYSHGQLPDAIAAAGEYIAYLASGGRTEAPKRKPKGGSGSGKGSRPGGKSGTRTESA